MRYDRQLLLLGPKRNTVLELAEVHAYGVASFGNADYVCIYCLQRKSHFSQATLEKSRTDFFNNLLEHSMEK